MRERQREEEKFQREQRRENERKEKFLLKESCRAEKLRQKEELRREKEAARLEAARERATARRIAKEYTELIEDERLELMELAAANKGLSSIYALDTETLQQLDSFRSTPVIAILEDKFMLEVVCIKVCNFDLYRPVWVVHTGPPGYWYADRLLPCGSVKNRPSAVDFGRQWPIEEEIDRRWSIEEENGKKKRKRKKKKRGRKNTLPACRRRPRSRLLFLPREEIDRGD
ncbi:hypothetical protein BHM03_00059250, partial [Ensete ventricosum]